MRRHAIPSILAVGLLLILAGCQGGPVLPAGPLGKLVASKEAVAVLTTGAVTVDGKLDEPVWKTAVAMGDFTRGRSDKPEVDTRVLVTFDKDNLYVAVINDEPNTEQLVTKVKDRDGDVWTDDSDEIYVDPSNSKTGDYQGFFVSAANVVYDRDNSGTGWDGKWTSAVSVQPGVSWTAEVAIPFTTLGVKPVSGQKLGVMVARNRVAGLARGRGLYLVPCDNEAKNTELYPVVQIP